jgi:histidine kinase/DNA gyrase B/HSP90-like ATPase
VGETRVDLLHLLEDLADAYPGELEETVLTEIIANALDSRARTIALITDAAAAALTVIDNGTGMRRADLRRFHDVAASTKQRGEGIGFAGVGIKLGLLISNDVVTETKRGAGHVATRWAMTNRKRAPWQWMPPPGMVSSHGTGWHDRTPRTAASTQTPGLGVRLLARHDAVLPADRRGIAISTYGKVIKRGWDWLGVTPAAADRVTGLIEAPALASALTLNKVDFLRAGPRGALYLSYRKGLQEAIMSQLAVWGGDADGDGHTRRRAARPVERDLEAILMGLASQFPMLATLVEKRAGLHQRVSFGLG